MMPAAVLPGGGTVSRPFIFAVVLILLFLSARTDLENPERKLETAAERGSEKRSAQARDRDAVSEKIMLDVSLDNERLEEVNRRLRLEVLALRREVRRVGGVLPAENETLIGVSAAQLGLDELQAGAAAGGAAAAQGVAAADFPAAGAGAVPATAGEAGKEAPPERRRALMLRRALGGAEQPRSADMARALLRRDAAYLERADDAARHAV